MVVIWTVKCQNIGGKKGAKGAAVAPKMRMSEIEG